MMNNKNRMLSGEAIWATSNAINVADQNHLKKIFEKHSTGLVEPLLQGLNNDREKDLLIVMLHAIKKLLDLDIHFSDELIESDSVRFTIETSTGFENISSLCGHPNTEIFLAASSLSNYLHAQNSHEDQGSTFNS